MDFNTEEQMMLHDIKFRIKSLIGDIKLPKDSYIAGGAFTSLFHNEEVQDIDVFVIKSNDNDPISIEGFESNLERFRSREKKKYFPNDSHIIAIFDDTKTRLQYIYSRMNDIKDLIETFDFVHSCVYYDVEFDKLWISRIVYDAIRDKTLINNNKTPTQSRIDKFTDRGFRYS